MTQLNGERTIDRDALRVVRPVELRKLHSRISIKNLGMLPSPNLTRGGSVREITKDKGSGYN
jgi:hypothetical protein